MKKEKVSKLRADKLATERSLCKSREEAQRRILAGELWIGDRRVEKSSDLVPVDAPLELRERKAPFVSRGGEKLQHALDAFAIAVGDRICLDLGASTGGFTDCLLRRGARKVFAVDVGYGQLDQRLREDARVVVMEKTNARFLTAAMLRERDPEADRITLAVCDVSFIGASKVLEPAFRELPAIVEAVVLFKPQFEVGPEHLGRGGVVRDADVAKSALDAFVESLAACGFEAVRSAIESPVPGKKSGNVEWLVYFRRARP
jgi:23S rRNA (cytidine1920-2'-O)/16S rRNA (cytidine1409-2'-O)-methyltransferase